MSSIYAGKKSPDLIDYLRRRRSTSVKLQGDPGPSADDMATILECAMRTPDHGKLFPWYFITFQGEQRNAFGKVLRHAWQKDNPDAEEAKLELESERLLRSPLVIAVISKIRPSKIPAWEQILSAGAVCQNLSLAANALGYGANWLTEWYSYHADVKAAMGLDEHDHIAGFIYIGTPKGQPEERDRPDPLALVSEWTEDLKPNKGVEYGKDKLGYAALGFDFKSL